MVLTPGDPRRSWSVQRDTPGLDSAAIRAATPRIVMGRRAEAGGVRHRTGGELPSDQPSMLQNTQRTLQIALERCNNTNLSTSTVPGRGAESQEACMAARMREPTRSATVSRWPCCFPSRPTRCRTPRPQPDHDDNQRSALHGGTLHARGLSRFPAQLPYAAALIARGCCGTDGRPARVRFVPRLSDRAG